MKRKKKIWLTLAAGLLAALGLASQVGLVPPVVGQLAGEVENELWQQTESEPSG